MIKSLARTLIPAPLWGRLSHLKRSAFDAALARAGYLVARTDDYYSPLPSVSRLKATEHRWHRPSDLVGVTYDLSRMEALLTRLTTEYGNECQALPTYDQVCAMGFGPGYTAVDGWTLYMMIRDLKPRRYLEIGCGVSTYYCSLAARQNAAEGHPIEITCVEPFPGANLASISGARLIKSEVQNLEPTFFQDLADNDVLFIDSSHVLKIDGDVPFLYLEVLPRLRSGVAIHVHDVPFPYNIPYPPRKWIFGPWPKFWNEAMVLQAFLCFNDQFEITLSTPMIRHFSEAFLRARLKIYESVTENANAFSSIWLRRV